MQVIHDNGGEITGFAFQQLLRLLNIKSVPTTTKNPQAHAICKLMHQTVVTVLKHSCLPNHHKHAAKLCCLRMMPWPLQFTPCGVWSQLHCRLCLEDLRSLETHFSIFLSLLIGKPSFQGESNWSMMLCFVPTKSTSTLTTRLVRKSSSMTKRLMANLIPNLLDPLTFFDSTLMALLQFHCNLIY